MAAPMWKKLPCIVTEVCLDKTLICGQSFRWKELETGEWVGVFADRVWKLRQNSEEILYQVCGRRKPHTADMVKLEPPEKGEIQPDKKHSAKKKKKESYDMEDRDVKPTIKGDSFIQLESTSNEYPSSGDEAVLRDYFQLSVNLSDLYKTWAKADSNFEKISKQFEGIRILRQEPVECLFAFICSSNNNITRISSMVEKLAVHYGEKIVEIDGIPYHAFPRVSALAVDGVEEKLRSLGFGYRAKYIQQSARFIADKGGEDWLYSLRDMKYKEAKAELMKLCGVGAKVADCVSLFCLDKTDAIPVDTHVWQIAARDYVPKLKQAKSLTDRLYEEIGDCFRSLWGPYAGWAHSVLFTADLKRFKEDAEKAKVSTTKRQPSGERSMSIKREKR